MNQAKLQAAAQIIKDSALQFLADKHGLTAAEVSVAIRGGNERAAEQFAKLVKAGVDSAIQLHNEGKISLM